MTKIRGNTFTFLLLLAAVVVLAGCQSPQKEHGAHAVAEKGELVVTEPTPGGETGPEVRTPIPGTPVPINEIDHPAAKNLCPRIHFDYDKSAIKDKWEPCLNNIAAFLEDYFQDHPNHILLIEGHCDERGSNEYNLALGERRAKSTMEFLAEKGVSSSRINTRSWGEEKPIAFCHEESCWWQNRRAEFYVVDLTEE